MVDVDHASIAELMDHAELEQCMPTNLYTLSGSLRHFVDLKGLGEILQTGGTIVHEVGDLQTGFILSLLLVE